MDKPISEAIITRSKLSFAIILAMQSATTLAEGNQPVSANQFDQLDAISVTANRVEEASLEVPASIGIVNKETIALDQPNYQKELLNGIAGVRITQTGSSIGHITSIRMPLNTGPYYLFLQDGIPVQSSGFFNHNGLAYTNFSSAGSAEVLKGAGTALYGSDSVAATVNVITDDPTQADGYSIMADTGSDGFYKLGLKAGGSYSEASAVGAEVYYSINEGWREHTSSDRTEATVSHFSTLNDNNALKTILSINSTEADMAGSLIGLDELKNNTTSVGDIASALESGLEIQRNFDFARLSTEWTHYLSDEVALSTIAYARSNRNRYVATWERNLPKNDSQEKSLGLMFKADIDKETLRWTFGSDIEVTKANRTYEQLFDYVPTGFGSSVSAGEIYDYDVTYVAFSPYARSEFDITEKTTIGAGLRYDTSKFNYTNNLAGGQYEDSGYLRASSDNDPSFNHLSPKLNVSYRIDNQQNIYVRYANGFRIPQASRLYSLKTNNTEFTLDPEVSDTFELGYKLATHTFRVDIAAYFMSIDDTIVGREDENGDIYYINGGETLHKGAELSGLYQINSQFSTRLAYSYSEHKYVNDAEYGDNEQAAAPNDTASLSFTYKPASVQGLTTEVEVEHVGEYWLDDKNTRTYDGYTIGHLKANYAVNEQLKVHAKITNVTDKVYAESASFSYGKEKYTPGAPRQFFAGVDFSF